MQISDQLRKAVKRHGSVYRVAKESGIPQSVLQRFAARQTGLSMRHVDELADFFGLRLARPKRPKGGTR